MRQGMHLDVQLTTSDWEATPRREMLAIWVRWPAAAAECRPRCATDPPTAAHI